jgi:hypothetical protein
MVATEESRATELWVESHELATPGKRLTWHLSHFHLKASQCLGTDLSGAHLTGATLEGWNIDHATNLHAIDSAYVYLLEPFDALGQRRDDHHRERLPHDPDKIFGPGDFETYFNSSSRR